MSESKEAEMTETEKTDSAIKVEKNEEVDEEAKVEISFFPPVYVQRYNRVSRTLENLIASEKEKFNSEETFTIMEVGCAEMNLTVHLKTIPGLEKIIFLDIDEDLLKYHKTNAAPFPTERLRPRKTPLKTEIYAGCITKCDEEIFNVIPKLKGVIGIEIIEHLHSDILTGFVRTIFGLLCPSIVILTTPNSEFNCVFNLAPGKFRHWDHKFEWTRKEFEDWCSRICSDFPQYQFTTEGIGEGKPETKVYGTVSQMVIFTHREGLIVPEESSRIEKYSDILQKDCYKLIDEYNYPFHIDTMTRAEKILKEFTYFANSYLITNQELYIVYEESNGVFCDVIEFGVEEACKIYKMPEGVTHNELREALEAKYTFKENQSNESVIVIPIPYSSDEIEPEDDMPNITKTNLNQDIIEECWD